MNIREAGTHSRPSAEAFEFKPSPSSPVYPNYVRRSVDSPLRGATNSWRGSTHSLSSIDRGTQTDEEDTKPSGHDQETKPTEDHPSPALKETEHVDDSDYDDDEHVGDTDSDTNAELETAVPVVARVVSVPKLVPPSLPPRNPHRESFHETRETM